MALAKLPSPQRRKVLGSPYDLVDNDGYRLCGVNERMTMRSVRRIGSSVPFKDTVQLVSYLSEVIVGPVGEATLEGVDIDGQREDTIEQVQHLVLVLRHSARKTVRFTACRFNPSTRPRAIRQA